MSKNLKTFLGISYLIILIAFLYFIFTSIEISKLNDFLYYKELQKDLSNFVSESIIANLIYFFIFAVLWVALLVFGKSNAYTQKHDVLLPLMEKSFSKLKK